MEVDFEKTVIFNFQEPFNIKGLRLGVRETAQGILSFTRIVEADCIEQKIAELAAPKNPVKSKVFTGHTKKSSIP